MSSRLSKYIDLSHTLKANLSPIYSVEPIAEIMLHMIQKERQEYQLYDASYKNAVELYNEMCDKHTSGNWEKNLKIRVDGIYKTANEANIRSQMRELYFMLNVLHHGSR